MSYDFELQRTKDKIEDLRKEQEQLTHNLMRTRRDEQYDLDRIRREYVTRINAMETRQIALEKEIKDRGRELERLERMKEKEEEEAAAEANQAREEKLRNRLR